MSLQPSTFGSLFRQARRSLELTLVFTARAMGLSPAYVCDVEHGRRGPLKASHLAKLDGLFPPERLRYLMELSNTISGVDLKLENEQLRAKVAALEVELAALRASG